MRVPVRARPLLVCDVLHDGGTQDDDQRLEGNYDQVVAWDAICELFFAKAADATTPDVRGTTTVDKGV